MRVKYPPAITQSRARAASEQSSGPVYRWASHLTEKGADGILLGDDPDDEEKAENVRADGSKLGGHVYRSSAQFAPKY